MDSANNIFEKLGGRKFLITVAVLVALITVAIVQPTALSTELVVGLLGVIATYSGSNAFLTSFAMRHPQQPTETPTEAPTESTAIAEPMPIGQIIQTTDYSAEIADLQARVAQNEKTTSEIIEIIKQLMQRK